MANKRYYSYKMQEALELQYDHFAYLVDCGYDSEKGWNEEKQESAERCREEIERLLCEMRFYGGLLGKDWAIAKEFQLACDIRHGW